MRASVLRFLYIQVSSMDWIGCGSEQGHTSWIGLDWVSEFVDWVGLDLAKWTHVQLWAYPPAHLFVVQIHTRNSHHLLILLSVDTGLPITRLYCVWWFWLKVRQSKLQSRRDGDQWWWWWWRQWTSSGSCTTDTGSECTRTVSAPRRRQPSRYYNSLYLLHSTNLVVTGDRTGPPHPAPAT